MKITESQERILVEPSRVLTSETLASVILELDRLQEEQLKADTLAYFAGQNAGRFSSLNDQSYRAASARRQERSLELIEQLKAADYEYKPLNFNLEFYIEAAYSERELAIGWKQRYNVVPKMPGIPNQSGCKHQVSAPTLQEGSDKALAEMKSDL